MDVNAMIMLAIKPLTYFFLKKIKLVIHLIMKTIILLCVFKIINQGQAMTRISTI
jgi:hypothetical protein